jgi:hypothetical protein
MPCGGFCLPGDIDAAEFEILNGSRESGLVVEPYRHIDDDMRVIAQDAAAMPHPADS